MKVIVGCESSGVIRDAFIRRGHDAWSCDLLPASGNHLQCDVREVLNGGWDLGIFHPPCTYLSLIGNAHWNKPGRAEKRQKALEFFIELFECDIPRICNENPLGHVNVAYRKPDQIIHPYYFGERHMKKTCLWLKNLPKLVWTKQDDLFSKRTATDKPEPIYVQKNGKRLYFTAATSGKPGEGNSFEKRSRTFQAIAEAMAEQWNF